MTVAARITATDATNEKRDFCIARDITLIPDFLQSTRRNPWTKNLTCDAGAGFYIRMHTIIRNTFLALSGAVMLAGGVAAQESNFANPTIDLGVVVSDLERSLKFYTEAVGFENVSSFTVPAGTATDAGLTNSKTLTIQVLKLGEGDGATSLKLMEVPGVRSRKSNNKFIHSQLGFSYITIHVKSTDKAMERLRKAGVKPVAKSPVELPESLAKGVYLTVLKDPDGNVVELVGPR